MAGINETARLLATLELQDKFSGPARNIQGSLGRLEGGFGRLSAGLGQMGRGVGQIGHGIDQIATRAAVAAVGLGTAFVTTAASMEEAFVGTEKTVDATEAQFEALRQKLRELSVESGTAFEELARIGEVGGALGVGVESLDEFIDVVNRLGVSTDLTTDAAATALGQLGTILHLTGSEYESFADTLVALGNAGASTEPQIVDLAARFAAAGNRAGLSSDEILALSSAVASMGVEVEAGGTALSQTFNGIALAIGTGSDEVQGFTQVLGISAAEFRRRWETDALGTFQDFLEEIGKLDPIAQAVALDMAGITGQRQLNAVGLMADNYGFVAGQLDIAKDAQGELRKESDKFYGTAAAGFRRVKESVRLAADAVGVELLPVLGELGEEFVDFLNDPAQQRAIKAFGEDLAGGIRSFIDEVKRFDFGPLIGTLQGAASIAKGAFDAFRSLPQPIQQLALAAIVANKVTGGAVGSIASGLGNIIAGGLKIAFLDRGTLTNPMIVKDIGGGLGGPGGVGGRGSVVAGAVGTLGAAAVATGGILAIEDIASGTEEGIIRGILSQGVPGLIGRAVGEAVQPLVDELLGSTDDLIKELVPIVHGVHGPPLPASMGGPGASGFGVGALQDLIAKIKTMTALPDTRMGLPDTAMQPLTTALGELTDVIRVTDPFGSKKTGTSEWAKGQVGIRGNFVESVKLDPSQITDLREPTRIAAEQARGWAALNMLELSRVKSEVAAQGGRQLAKQDAIAAAVRANTSVLSSKDYAPKFSLTANVTNNVSISEIQRKITSQSVALGVDPAGSRAV